MIMQDLVDKFERKAPVCVMVRALLENVLSPERLDAIYDQHDHQQPEGVLLFSTLVEIMGLVATRIHSSVHAAYQAKLADIAVTAKAVYDKLQRIKTDVSQALVRQTAARMKRIVEATGRPPAEPLPGYRVLILDGNHMRRTQRRLKVLRTVNGAPLPGHSLVVLDPQWKLVVDVFPCEDAHAQERSLLSQVLKTVKPGEVWVDDRNFCTIAFLFGIRARKAFFVTRQHGSMPFELVGRRSYVGRCETGHVYEQQMRIVDPEGMVAKIRRVTIVLDEPTRDGDTEIHILTNLPRKVSALKVAALYRQRWTIEAAFNEVAQNLEGEIETLGYPKAALFGFCVALVSYNLLSMAQRCVENAHPKAADEHGISIYYLAAEVARCYEGLEIAVGDTYWTKRYRDILPDEMARQLLRIAQHIVPARYRKHKRGPKKPPPKMNKQKRNHVSTARLLNAS
jgi:Transposase DDE domain